MASTLSERIAKALEHANSKGQHISKTDIAREAHVRPSTVTAWFSGQSKNIRASSCSIVAKYLGVNDYWLANGKGEMVANNIRVVDIDEFPKCADDRLIPISEYEVHASAGGGANNVEYDVCDACNKAFYRRDWFTKRGLNPRHCRRMKVVGDSMEPYIWDRDRILVDCEDNDLATIKEGKVYVFLLGDEMRVKILRKDAKRGLYIESFNNSYPVEHFTHEELEAELFVLIGRVRDRSGSGEL